MIFDSYLSRAKEDLSRQSACMIPPIDDHFAVHDHMIDPVGILSRLDESSGILCHDIPLY